MKVISDKSAKRLGGALSALVTCGILAVLAGSCAVAPPPSGSSGLDPDRLARLDAALESYVESGTLPGAVALVASRGETLYLKAFGHRDREAGDPLEPDDIFRIASQTKAIVSVAIMILQEEGRLLISDPVGRHLPEYGETTVASANPDGTYDVVPARRPITIRHLLTHTAGIGYGQGPAAEEWAEAEITGWYFAHREEPIRETVRRMASLPFDAQPGERWVYGYATDILGAVVEGRLGSPARRVPPDPHLRTARDGGHPLLSPTRKAGSPHRRVFGRRRRPHPRSRSRGMVGQGAYLDGPRVSFSGGAGILSTAADYARLLQMMLNGGKLGDARILSPKSVELMTVDHLGGLLMRNVNDTGALFGEESGVGFGSASGSWTTSARAASSARAGEYGWGGAYHSSYWVDPKEELVVVYLAQLIPAGNLDDHARFRALIYQAIDAAN